MGYTLAFTYDHNHNRKTKVTGTGGSAVTDTYSYDAHNKLTSISGGTNKTYGYDSNGNCTSVTVDSAVTYVAYDVENRVTSITYPSSATNTFAYNGEDLRTQFDLPILVADINHADSLTGQKILHDTRFLACPPPRKSRFVFVAATPIAPLCHALLSENKEVSFSYFPLSSLPYGLYHLF